MKDTHERVTECQGMIDHWKHEKLCCQRLRQELTAGGASVKWPQPEDDRKYLELCDRIIEAYEADLRRILEDSTDVVARSPEPGQTVYKVSKPEQLQLF